MIFSMMLFSQDINECTYTYTRYMIIPFSTFSTSFGMTPSGPMAVQPLFPNQSANVSLPVSYSPAQVMKMDPITNVQVAVKNNVSVMYFATLVPMNIHFSKDGAMGKKCASLCKTAILMADWTHKGISTI